MGDARLGAKIEAFKTSLGKGDVELNIDTLEGQLIKRDWALQEEEVSPEVNNELMYCLKREYERLIEALKEGKSDEAREAFKYARKLFEKLEKGVNAVQCKEKEEEMSEEAITKKFQRALKGGYIKEAEEWLEERIRNRMVKYGEAWIDWIDQRQEELFQAYCKTKSRSGMDRIIRMSIKDCSRQKRIETFEQFTGGKYKKV